MCFWGATVITNLFSAIPLVGNKIVIWLWGGFSVGDYLLPFVIIGLAMLYVIALHAMLRSIPDKLTGVLTMFASILVWFLLSWLDKSKLKSGARPVFKQFFWLFAINLALLAWLGGQEVKEPYFTMSRLATIYYFTYFVIILLLLSKYEKPKEPPKILNDSVPEMK